MTKRSHKRSSRSEKGNAGCMWGLINMLDFRQARSSQKLLSDRRHGSGRPTLGNGLSRSKYSFLTTYKEKHEDLDYAFEIAAGNADLGTTSVKKLMEEEMSKVQQHKHISRSESEPKPNSGCGPHFEKNLNQADSASWVFNDPHATDLRVSTSLEYSQSEFQNIAEIFSNNFYLATLLQEFCGGIQRDRDGHDGFKKIDLFQNDFVLKKPFNEVLEALLCNQFFDRKQTTSDGTCQLPEELMNALEILKSNQDLFLEALHDPNSSVVKFVQNLQSAYAENMRALESCKLWEEVESSGNETVTQEQHVKPVGRKIFLKQNIKNIFRKDKQVSEKPSSGYERSQAPNRIVLLKPIPARAPSPSNEASPSSSPQSPYSFRANRENGRAAFGFSFREIKKRLKHAIKERKEEKHLISIDRVLHRTTYGFHDSWIGKRIAKEVTARSKNSCSSEQAAWSSHGAKRREDRIKPEEALALPADNSETNKRKTVCHLDKESNFQREAKKHLLEMLNCGDGSGLLPARQVSKSLAKILTLQEYNLLSPRFSPGRHKEPGLSPRQMRFSPIWSPSKQFETDQCSTIHNLESLPCGDSSSNAGLQNLQMNDDFSVIETLSPAFSHGRHKEPGLSPQQLRFSPIWSSNQQIDTNNLSTLRHNLESSPHNGIDTDAACNVLDSNSGLLETQIKEGLFVKEASSHKDIESVEQSSSTDIISEDKIVDVSISCENDGSPPWLKLAEEKLQSLTPSVPPGVLFVHNAETPESIIEKPERPSPVSVLEPPFMDDITSPGNTALEQTDRGFPISPREIHFEEYDSSEVALTTSPETNLRTCMEDEGFKFEYVRSLLEASGLRHYESWERWHCSYQLLDPLLYDVVETPTGEIPDDLKLLFDCISEVLEDMHEKYFSCMPWLSSVKPGILPFPSGEYLIKEVCKGIYRHLTSEFSHTLHQLIKIDMDASAWVDVHSAKEDVGDDVGDDILEDILEETALELWG